MKSSYTIVFTLLTTLSFSQRLEITKGPLIDPKQIRNDLKIPRFVFGSFSYSSALFFNPAKNRTYTGYGFKDNGFNFGVWDNYLTYSGVRKLSAENINDRVTLEAFVLLEDKMYVLYTIQFPDQDSFSIYVNEVSEDMVILGSPIVLHNFKNLKDNGMDISVQVSRNKENILINRFFTTKPKANRSVECKVVNTSFSEVWYKMIEMQSMDRDINIRSVNVDNEGNWYCLAENTAKKSVQPMTYTYFWKSGSLKTFQVGLNTGENFGTMLTLLNGDKACIVGLNENDKKVSYFLQRVDASSQALVNLGSGLMPENFETPKDWSVHNMISLDNNTIIASVEAILEDTERPIRYSFNAYVLAFREDGTQAWARVIRKRQTTIPGFEGHLLLPAGNNVLVIYNDIAINLNKKPEDPKIEAFANRDGMVVVQEIDPDGNVRKYPLMNDPDLKNYLLNFKLTARIKPGLYYASCVRLKGLFSGEFRNITITVK